MALPDVLPDLTEDFKVSLPKAEELLGGLPELSELIKMPLVLDPNCRANTEEIKLQRQERKKSILDGIK